MCTNVLMRIFLFYYVFHQKNMFHVIANENRIHKKHEPQTHPVHNYEESPPYWSKKIIPSSNEVDSTIERLSQDDANIALENDDSTNFEERSLFHGRSFSNDGRDERWLGFGGGGNKKIPIYPKMSHLPDGSNVQWSVWQADGEPTDNADDTKTMKPPPPNMMPAPARGEVVGQYHHYHHFEVPWKDDAWKSDAAMPMMPAMMNDMMPDMNKKGFSILDKLVNIDPMALLVAGIIPLGLLLAAVLPSLMHMMMNGNGLPTFTTTASGGNGGGSNGDSNTRYLESTSEMLFKIIGGKNQDQQHCIHQIICRVAKGSVQTAYRKASTLFDSEWMELMGIKKLIDYLSENDCEDISCSLDNNAHTHPPDKSQEGG